MTTLQDKLERFTKFVQETTDKQKAEYEQALADRGFTLPLPMHLLWPLHCMDLHALALTAACSEALITGEPVSLDWEPPLPPKVNPRWPIPNLQKASP